MSIAAEIKEISVNFNSKEKHKVLSIVGLKSNIQVPTTFPVTSDMLSTKVDLHLCVGVEIKEIDLKLQQDVVIELLKTLTNNRSINDEYEALYKPKETAKD
jgi:hypothetical protein